MTNESEQDLSRTEAAPALDLSDEKTVRGRNKKLKAKEELRRKLIAQFLSSQEAREWMYDLLSDCHIYAPSHIPGDPYSTAFREGERNLGLRLLADIPSESYALILKEAQDRANG